MLQPPFKPTPADLLAANGKSIPILIASDLKVLFCGINPGLWSAATGHHFAWPGNRFWPALHAGGFTPRVLKPHEQGELLAQRLGITNFVERASARASFGAGCGKAFQPPRLRSRKAATLARFPQRAMLHHRR